MSTTGSNAPPVVGMPIGDIRVGISRGMQRGIADAQAAGRPVECRSINGGARE